jgi:hypothetical protein
MPRKQRRAALRSPIEPEDGPTEVWGSSTEVASIYVGWIKEFPSGRGHTSLRYTDSQSEGFVTAFKEQARLNRGIIHPARSATRADFLPGPAGEASVNAHHAVYFSSHGAGPDGPTFYAEVAGSGEDSLGPCVHHVRWGGRLRLVVFDVCATLSWLNPDATPGGCDDNLFAKWGPAFNGLYYLLGFRNNANDEPYRGRYFAEYLLEGLPIREAWIRACQETSPPKNGTRVYPVLWAYMRAGASTRALDTYDAGWRDVLAREPELREPDYWVWITGCS